MSTASAFAFCHTINSLNPYLLISFLLSNLVSDHQQSYCLLPIAYRLLPIAHCLSHHSGDGEAVCPLHPSRRCLACSKNSSMALASAFSSANWNSCKSSTNTPRTRARFLRFASAISRHISGELEAMRVVSRNPLAHSIACSLGCTGLRT